jgi:hypothetical protein
MARAPSSSPRPSQRPQQSSAPTSSPRPQMRDPVRAQQFIDSQGGDDSSTVAAAVQSPAVQQGIASIFGGGQQSFNPFNFGIMGIAKNLIDSLAGGGDGGPSGRPQMRPSVINVARGEGDDRRMDMVTTRDMPRFGFTAGDTAAVPDYSPFSLRGLTSTDPGNVMRNIQGAERMARIPTDTGAGETAPTAPIAPPVDPAAMPTDRPAWWPPNLPWPPTPRAAAPMPTYTPPPVAPVMPGQQYSTSYSGLQNAISGAGNPMMMGIGGMVRRP